MEFLLTGDPFSARRADLLVDDIVPGAALRQELIKRLAHAESNAHEFPPRRNGVYPV